MAQNGPPPTDFLIRQTQFTKTLRTDTYPAIDVGNNPELKGLLKGKVVLITGASRGIAAKGFVPAFAEAGAKALILVSRNHEALLGVESGINKTHPDVQTLVSAIDITDHEKVDELWKEIEAKFGHVDVLINNASTASGGAQIKDIKDTKQWLAPIECAVRGSLYMTVPFLRLLPDSSHGTIINLTSVGTVFPMPGTSSYAYAKAFAPSFSASLAAEIPSGNITVIALHPGLIDNGGLLGGMAYFAKETNELAGGTAVWLCSEKARWLHGKYVNATWDMEELSEAERKKEIEGKGDLKLKFGGDFGSQYFA